MSATNTAALTRTDVIVIGSGIAGLTAGAFLSQQGYRVVVLERDVHVGGCAASYSRDGYRFAVGATVGMGFETGGLHHKVCQRLGIDVDYRQISPALRVHLPDRVVPVSTQPDAWLAQVPQYFPELPTDQLRAFWREIARISSGMRYISKHFPVLPFRHPWDVLDTARAAHPSLWHVARNLFATINDKLETHNVNHPAHRAFIDGQLLDAMQTDSRDCVATAGSLALNIYRHGCQYVTGGLTSLAEALAAYIEARGGEFRFGQRVKTIMSDNKRVQGVLSNRAEIHAPLVISAIPLENTAELLDNSSLERRSENQSKMWGAFTLYMGIDERCLPDDHHYFEQITDVDHYHDGGNLLMSISPAWDTSRAPAGKRAVTVSTHVDAEPWMALDRKSEAYTKKKYALEQHMLDQIERAVPRIREGIAFFQSGSPRTFHSFTLRAGGTVGGFPQTHKHAVFNAPSHRTSTQGLFLAGDTIFPGQGTLGTTVSGYNAARSAHRYLQRLQHRRGSP